VVKATTAHDYLKDEAINGRLRPGVHLAPNDLADQLRFSVTPIRDALTLLAYEGFLIWRPSQGFFTKPFVVKEQRDLMQVTGLGTVSCLDLGARTDLDVRVQAIADLSDETLSDSGDMAEQDAKRFAYKVEDVYIEAAGTTENEILVTQVKNYLDRTHLVRLLDYRSGANRHEIAGCLYRSAAFVLAGDVNAALQEVRTQLAAFTERLPTLVAFANARALESKFP